MHQIFTIFQYGCFTR